MKYKVNSNIWSARSYTKNS